MKKSVRMADIAAQLGISTVSVSKAMSGKPGVSEEMRARVIALARQMGYSGVRVRYGPGLTGNIGILVSERLFTENPFYTVLYRELVMRSGEEGYSCILELISRESEQAAIPPPLVEQRRVDGLLFLGALAPGYLKAVMAAGIPCLALDFRIPGLRLDSVRRDNTEGGFLLTEHLLSAGYRKIGFAGDIGHSNNIMERYWGYRWALQKAGITPCDSWLWKKTPGRTEHFHSFDELPQAVVCGSSEFTFYLMDLWQRSGAPDSMGVTLACFDEPKVLLHAKPQIVTYQAEPGQMAEIAIQHLLRKLHEQTTISLNHIVSGKLIGTLPRKERCVP